MTVKTSVSTTIFPHEPGLAHLIGANDNASGGDNWSRRVKLQSNRHHQQTNTQLYS